jgi:hypothetical protein
VQAGAGGTPLPERQIAPESGIAHQSIQCGIEAGHVAGQHQEPIELVADLTFFIYSSDA